MEEFEIRRVNNSLLVRLVRQVGEIEKKNEWTAKQCSLVLNDAIIKINKIGEEYDR